jgi:predicted acylesterase/phospholipase RssA
VHDGSPRANPARLPHLRIANAVAASSAFPPFFPPVVLDPARLKVNLPSSERLTDAGVLDNLGIVAGAELAGDDELLVSDASAAFLGNSWSEYRFIVGRSVRTTDILMSRVAELDTAEAEKARPAKIYKAAISDQLDDADVRARGIFLDHQLAIPKSMQHWVALVRTDLDRFSEEEIAAIYAHGYAVAAHAFAPLATFRRKNDVVEIRDAAMPA